MLRKLGAIVLVAAAIIGTGVVQAQRGEVEQTWTVNFKDSDIHEVIKFITDVTGKTVVVDPRVKGRVKVISNKPLNEDELIELFRTVLEVHDFTVVEVGNVVRILPIKDARSSPLPVVGDDDPASLEEEGYVTQVIQLKNIAAAKVLPVLRPLVPQHSHLAAYDPSNAIVVSDTAANIERLRKVIEKIDTAALPTTEVIQLKYADANELVTTLTKLGRSGKQATPASNKLQMVADKRNNAILISGEDLQRQRVKALIRQLDRPQAQTGNVRVVYLEYASAKEVAKVLTKVVQNMQKMTPGDKKKAGRGATVEADEDTNALLITANGDLLNALMAVVERLDIRRAQVLVEAIIVEIEGGEDQNLGIDWLFQNQKDGVFGSSIGGGRIGGIAEGMFSATSDDLRTAALARGLAGTPGQVLGVAGLGGGEDFMALLNILEEDTKTNILSTPSLLTMDNHEATISVGQNVPFVTGSFTSTGGTTGASNPFQTIQREDVGINLTVTPHVNEGDKILMEISQEISSLSGATNSGASDIVTNQRKVDTQILAQDGEIIILGGLIKEDVQQTRKKVPFLGDIPLLGRLFRSSSSALRKSNLMIFIRPTIVRDDETLRGATAEKYRYIRDVQIQQRNQGVFRMDDDVLPVLPDKPPGSIEELYNRIEAE